MKIIILGSGLLGVTAAYELGKRGFEVTVFDRGANSASETSYANGGQLSYSHAEPWASPSVLHKLPRWMLRDDSPLVLRPRADWQMIKWSLKFLRNCTKTRAEINTVNMLRLGLYSREKMREIRANEAIEFNFSDKGILHLYGTAKDFEAGKKQVEFQAKFGGSERILSYDEVLKLEPTLAHTSRTIVGGIHANHDESGDAHAFCVALAARAAEKFGVKFEYGVNILGLKKEGDKIVAISTDKGDFVGDKYIMSMGSYSSVALRKLGIDVPIYPMKGYSITLNANEFCPNISLTDGTHKIVYSRLGDELRIAGTAEFAGYNDIIREKRIAPIVRAVQTLFPKADFTQEISKWACLRPSTPDGPPIIGKTPISNLFMNTGHGTLGWTQSAGSASIIADIIEEKPPEIILHGLTMERYGK